MEITFNIPFTLKEQNKTRPKNHDRMTCVHILPLAVTMLVSCPPKISLNSEGTKLCVLITADLFFRTTVSHSSSSAEATTRYLSPLVVEDIPSSFSNSACIRSMTKLKNSCASSCLDEQNNRNLRIVNQA